MREAERPSKGKSTYRVAGALVVGKRESTSIRTVRDEKELVDSSRTLLGIYTLDRYKVGR